MITQFNNSAKCIDNSFDNQKVLSRPSIKDLALFVSNKCINCTKCITECAFLNENGTPGRIADNFALENPLWLRLAFDCSLCGLCSAVCPVGLSPEEMFLEMRREAVEHGVAPMPGHKGIIAYEKRGVSKKYSWYSLPDGCDTVLFPGCTFAGTRMDTTIALYEYLKQSRPQLGIVLDCCCKSSHDLGRNNFFHDMFTEMRNYLIDHGVTNVIVVCPNCYKVFETYGDILHVISAYELLTEDETAKTTYAAAVRPNNASNSTVMAIHDPCVLRNEKTIQDAVRKLVADRAFIIKEMPHSRKKTMCCGEGGAVGFITPEFSGTWSERRKEEAGNYRLLTYCAGCAGLLNRKIPTDHILDAVFFPQDVAAGKRKFARAPLTYFNRIRLKRYFQKHHPASVFRERTYISETDEAPVGVPVKGGAVKFIILLLIIAAIGGLRFSGILENFDSETLQQGVVSLGPLAPLVFILLYTIAPALFLPGLPLTIAGGILFGPLWGVVYSITGATFGASLSFLVSRYIARDWVAARLTGPHWKQLDESVEKNGWKIIAFTRLVPLFPFNLLNYAFGLTPIRFLPYAVTSFICMLPACIAFIVFSSSLVDLLKGKISPSFLIGIFLIALVSAIPLLLRKLKNRG
ncbi:MAG: VTT domain-containing protein [Proteobacteria bacterium]|nr:VTT domain-containing protein [Pseudomonadota bacterium]